MQELSGTDRVESEKTEGEAKEAAPAKPKASRKAAAAKAEGEAKAAAEKAPAAEGEKKAARKPHDASGEAKAHAEKAPAAEGEKKAPRKAHEAAGEAKVHAEKAPGVEGEKKAARKPHEAVTEAKAVAEKAPVGAAEGEAKATGKKPAEAKGAPAKGAKGGKGSSKGKAEEEPEVKENLDGYVPRLRIRYQQEVVPALVKEFGYKNPMEVPKLKKVVVNIGLGEAITNQKALEAAEKDMSSITGQHPVITKAKKAISAFKLRAGMPIGMMVTLRGSRMHEFLDKLFNIGLPRIRDFRGASTKGFDGRGNYTLGLKEQVMFPEIDYTQIDRIRGLQITIVTSARSDAEARRLLELLGMAFSKEAVAAGAR